MIWREILLQLLSLSGDEGDEHKWVVPSAVSTETHKELTIRQLFHHLGFFASDAVLENAVSAFFTKHAERASVYVNQHLRDPDDPSGLILDSDISSTADLLDRMRFSSLILEGGTIRRCSTQELNTSLVKYSCRMTHAKIWKDKREHFGIIFQPERFGIILRLWLLLLREGLRCPSQLGGGGGQESSS
jgi:hypothetical protein